MASDSTSTPDPATLGTGEAGGTPDQGAPVRRTRRRAAAAPAAAQATSPAAAEVADGGEDEGPRTKAPAKRARAAQAKPAEAAAGGSGPEATDEAPAAAKAAKAAKKAKSAKKTTTAKKATSATAGERTAGAGSRTATTGSDPGEPADTAASTAGGDRASATAGSAPSFAPAPEAPTGAALGGGSLGLVFQAPDPAPAPRHRRATAPVQAPAERADSSDQPQDADASEGSPAPRAGSPRRGRGTGRAAAAQEEPRERDAVEPGDEQELPEGPDEGEDEQGDTAAARRRRRRGGRGRRGRGGTGEPEQDGASEDADAGDQADVAGRRPEGAEAAEDGESGSSRRRRRRRRGGSADEADNPPGTVTRVRAPRKEREEPTAVKGSTRLEAKKQRRREGREAGRRRTIITEAEFLARRESVERIMVVRGVGDRTQIGVLEDGVLVEHYVSRETTASMAGNVYLGRVQNVLPSMEAAFVDIGKGRNAVLYAGEVNWDAAGLEANQPKRIENALSSGDTVLVQVTKDPIGHKGARLTSQISLPGRYLVYVPEGSMTGISRKLPDTERARLKAILKEVVPDTAGVIVRTAAEGASEEELRADVLRLTATWDAIAKQAAAAAAKKASSGGAPVLLHGEPDLTVRVIRDVFTEDFTSLVVSGEPAWSQVNSYVSDVAPDLADRVSRWSAEDDVFAHYRIDEQLAKAMDRKVWLPSGGSLVIDRTEAMTVIDVNTGKFVGSGGNLEETVTKNNVEAAEEIVRQLRLRDIGGIIVIDFIDMVLESNRDLVVRRLLECLGRDRTKHQVAEVTSLGLVQMTRKRVGSGLIEVFSEPCDHCNGRGLIIHTEPVARSAAVDAGAPPAGSRQRSTRQRGGKAAAEAPAPVTEDPRSPSGPTPAQIAAAAHAAAIKGMSGEPTEDDVAELVDLLPGLGRELAEADEPTDGLPVDAGEGSALAGQDGQPGAEDDVPEEPPAVEPPVRTRRRRGRVVAPAGPPRAVDGAPSSGGTEEATDAPADDATDTPAEEPTDTPADDAAGGAGQGLGEGSADLVGETPDR